MFLREEIYEYMLNFHENEIESNLEEMVCNILNEDIKFLLPYFENTYNLKNYNRWLFSFSSEIEFAYWAEFNFEKFFKNNFFKSKNREWLIPLLMSWLREYPTKIKWFRWDTHAPILLDWEVNWYQWKPIFVDNFGVFTHPQTTSSDFVLMLNFGLSQSSSIN